MRLVLPLLLLFLAPACTHKTGLVITGHTLLELEHQFTLVADAMDKGLDSGAVSADEYRAWREFGVRFQASYPQALSTWRKSRKANDAALRGDVGAAAGSLISELGGYLDLVVRLGLVPKGAVP